MSPAQAQALLQQGLQLQNAGRPAPALACYQRLGLAVPRSFEAHHLAGTALLQLSRFAEAESALTRALTLHPRSATTAMCLGLALGYLGKLPPALQHARAATRLDPRNSETWCNLASLLILVGQLDDAASAYQQALKLSPDNPHPHTGLGRVRQLLHRPTDAIAHHTRALELDPRHDTARFARAQALQNACRDSEALADLDAHLALYPAHHEARSQRLLLLNYRTDFTREEIFAQHQSFAKHLPPPPSDSAPSPFAPRPSPGRTKLRLALLSPDLRRHSVAYFLKPLLAHLPRDRFEIFLYHDHFNEDDMSAALRAHADHWRNFVGQAPEVAAATIRADAPDILVDLAGHTGFNRLPLLAQRLAPVQISYLGYPNTTGLPTMDFRLTDAIADPADSDAFHTETLLRFAPSAWCYEPPAEAPPVSISPYAKGAPLIFGSFNNFAKLSDPTLRLWARLLDAHPGSRLVLKSPGLTRAHLDTRLRALAFPLERVVLLDPPADTAAHLALYAQIALALDPFPYNGTTTTCEALWQGIPVISLHGDRHASRVGASLLTAVGHPEWIAENETDYLHIAAKLISDPTRLATLRANLRNDLKNSPLLDHAAQSARFTEALLTAHSEKLASISVH